MNLFKNLWETKTGKRILGGTMAATLAIGSIFGFAGCSTLDQNEQKIETQQDQNQKEVEVLKELVASLNSVVLKLDSNEELKEELKAIEEKIEALQNTSGYKEVLDEIKAMVEKLQKDVTSINDRLDALEANKEVVEKEEILEISNDLAKAKAKLAVINAFENKHMQVSYENCEMITAPNGNIVGINKNGTDYLYYNNQDNAIFMSAEGKDACGVITEPDQLEHLDFKTLCIKTLEDTSLVLDEEKSTELEYVFKDEDGLTFTVILEDGDLKGCGSDYIQVTESSIDKFVTLLNESKSILKSIGVFESFKKEVDASLSYKYQSLTSSESNYGDTICVLSGKLCAVKTQEDERTIYGIQTNEKSQTCEFNEKGQLEEFWENGIQAEDMAQSFKDDVMLGALKNGYFTISQDAQTGAYLILPTEEDNHMIHEIKFNEDLSVEVKITWKEQENNAEETITYKVEKISKEKFDNVYNRILEICEQAKEQQSNLIQ